MKRKSGLFAKDERADGKSGIDATRKEYLELPDSRNIKAQRAYFHLSIWARGCQRLKK
jgi:hypothetical protein